MSRQNMCPECEEENPSLITYSFSTGFKEMYCRECVIEEVGETFKEFHKTGKSIKHIRKLQPVKVDHIQFS